MGGLVFPNKITLFEGNSEKIFFKPCFDAKKLP